MVSAAVELPDNPTQFLRGPFNDPGFARLAIDDILITEAEDESSLGLTIGTDTPASIGNGEESPSLQGNRGKLQGNLAGLEFSDSLVVHIKVGYKCFILGPLKVRCKEGLIRATMVGHPSQLATTRSHERWFRQRIGGLAERLRANLFHLINVGLLTHFYAKVWQLTDLSPRVLDRSFPKIPERQLLSEAGQAFIHSRLTTS